MERGERLLRSGDLSLFQWRLLYLVDSLFAASEIYPSARDLAELMSSDRAWYHLGGVVRGLEVLVDLGLLETRVVSGVTRYRIAAGGREKLGGEY